MVSLAGQSASVCKYQEVAVDRYRCAMGVWVEVLLCRCVLLLVLVLMVVVVVMLLTFAS